METWLYLGCPVKDGCIPEDWKSSVILPIYKGKGDPMECGPYRGIKLLHPVFSVSHVQHISDMHSKFALRSHHMWKYGSIQSATAENRRGGKNEERKKKKPQV